MAKERKPYIYNGYEFSDNGHGDLFNAELDKFLIFRPYPLMVSSIIHKDGSVTMNQEKFKENTDKNKGVYEEGYEINDDGSVFVKEEDVDPKIKQEAEDNKNPVDEKVDYKGNEFDQEHTEGFYKLMNDDDTYHYSERQVRAMEMYDLGDFDYKELRDDYFNGDSASVGKALRDYGSERYLKEMKDWETGNISFAGEEYNEKINPTKDNVQHEYTSYFTLENPLADTDDAQSYLSENNVTQYLEGSLKEKVDSIDWVLDDDQSGHVEIKTNSTLTDQEQKDLEDWIDGQNSDGLGENFEQKDFANGYWNPDTGDGPYTYEEAKEEIDNIIENVSVDEYFDYIDESEIEAAIDTYLEDNDLITEYKDNNWDAVKDELFSFCSTDDIIDAAQTIKGDDLTDEEMDLVYDNFDSDPDYKEQIAQELWQNLASYEQADLVKGVDQDYSLRDEARDGIYDDPEGYISDDAIFEAKEDYAREHYNIEIDDWGGMSSIRRSVNGLQDKVIETTWIDWLNENFDRDKTPSKIAQDYQKVMDNINRDINSYSNEDRFDIADSYLERNGITESNGYDTSYIMRLRNGIIESLHIDENSNPRDFGVTDEDIKLANEYDKENNRKSWDEVKGQTISDRYIENPIISNDEKYDIEIDDGETITKVKANGIDEARTIKDDNQRIGKVRIFDSEGGEIIEDKDQEILELARQEYGYDVLSESNVNDIARTGNRIQQEAAENQLSKINLAKQMLPNISSMSDIEKRNLMRSIGKNYKSLNSWSGQQLYSILEKELNKLINGR